MSAEQGSSGPATAVADSGPSPSMASSEVHSMTMFNNSFVSANEIGMNEAQNTAIGMSNSEKTFAPTTFSVIPTESTTPELNDAEMFDSIQSYLNDHNENSNEPDTTSESVEAFLRGVREPQSQLEPEESQEEETFSMDTIIQEAQETSVTNPDVLDKAMAELELMGEMDSTMLTMPDQETIADPETKVVPVVIPKPYPLIVIELAKDVQVARKVLTKRIETGMSPKVAKEKTIADMQQVFLLKTKASDQPSEETQQDDEVLAQSEAITQAQAELQEIDEELVPKDANFELDFVFEEDPAADAKREKAAFSAVDAISDPSNETVIFGKTVAAFMPSQITNPDVKSEIAISPKGQKDYGYEEVKGDIRNMEPTSDTTQAKSKIKKIITDKPAVRVRPYVTTYEVTEEDVERVYTPPNNY